MKDLFLCLQMYMKNRKIMIYYQYIGENQNEEG